MSHRYWRRRHPPPWWPADEPWPPAGPPHSLMRRNFYVGLAALIVVSLVLASVVLTLVLSIVAAVGGASALPPAVIAAPRPIGAVVGIFGFIALIVVVRAFRRVAVPLGELVEAAGRVADGDYSVRVSEKGTMELRMLAHAFNSMAARLQANDEQRRNLLADVTHELRTPLTVVQGNLEGLVDGIYPMDREHLEPILDETRVLARLIEDLRTLALAESGALKLQKQPTDMATLVTETVASFRPQADAAGVNLQAEAGMELPLAQVDPGRIREVLVNLLANALRFTPRGGSVRVRCEMQGPGALAVSVADTGAGIPPEDLPHIFDRMHKSRDSRGTGLGLAIARNLVAAHGGEIFAESEPGRGATIRFTLPVRQEM